MELINRIRKSRKGFTLVEIIVVLVILAILAAFTIPTMLGFVSDAKDKAYIAEAREIYVASQAIATETYGTTKANPTGLSGKLSTITNSSLKQMLGSDIDADAEWTVAVTDGKVTSVTYEIPDSTRSIIISGGKTTIS